MIWLLVLLAGCSPVLFQLGTDVSPERKAWERQVSETLNDHEARLQAREGSSAPDPKGEMP